MRKISNFIRALCNYIILLLTHFKTFYIPIPQPIFHEIIEITEIWPRRYQHIDVGMEFFLESGTTMFIIFTNKNDRDTLEKYFMDKVAPCPDNDKLALFTQQWREGQLTNWEYLTMLNQMSGRTYHDLMQYPVFPWILSDYSSAVLDLSNARNFRILEKPIAVQHVENEDHYINTYQVSESYIN